MPLLYFIFLLVITFVGHSNGGSSLSIQPSLLTDKNPSQLLHYTFSDDISEESSHVRNRRDTLSSLKSTATATTSKIKSTVTLLNDSHSSLMVYWAGKDVIICLAKDFSQNSTSTLYISRDYGGSFDNVSLAHFMPNGETPSLDKVLNHPNNNGKFVLTDVTNQFIFTTDNYGVEFRGTKVLFVPDQITFDPQADDTILAYEKSTHDRRLWVSRDFGMSWTMAAEYVKSAIWDESVTPSKLYIERQEPEPDGRNVVLTSDSLFMDHKDTTVVLENVEEFEIKDDFMFATKKGVNDTVELWISYKHGPFYMALIPTRTPIKYFHIADVSDGQIFLCVTHDNSVTDLYVGNEPEHNMESPRFSLSLPRIVFFSPNRTYSDSWINDVTKDSFVDLHKLDGLRGVYVATVVKPPTTPNRKDEIKFDGVMSLVTFDSGGTWETLKSPEFDDDGQPIYCQYTQKDQNCSLQISQRLSELYPHSRAVPILSKKSAVGIVLATGTVNTTLKGHLNVYMSTNGAVTWRQILHGNYLFNFGDHGGILVAVKFYKIGDATNILMYSTDEGNTWNEYEFYHEKVKVLGLMTEPGENTTVFFVFGSTKNGQNQNHSWILIKVDFKNVFDRICQPADYKMWSPWDSKQGRDCLLGKKETYERRIGTRSCYNGRSYERLVKTTKCICDRIDFECDFGYVENSLADKKCMRDTSETSPGVKAEWCKPGNVYYNRTKGYRKIPGDVCEGGDIHEYLPDTVPCKVNQEAEFMLVAKRDSVLRVDLNDFSRVETLPLLKVPAVIAIDFDMKNNCLFWADVNKDNIMRLHLDGNSTPEVLVSTDLKSVEGLAFDWLSHNLYFCDGAQSKIEVIRTDVSIMGRMRKKLLGKDKLDKPRGIAVHPSKSLLFWTDWSAENPCIGRSWLDGTNVEKIVKNHPGEMINLKWPNGITIDYQDDKLYWVDAHLDQMVKSDLDGKNIQVYMEKDLRLKHPFAVGIYKDLIYWDDWATHSIYFTRKNVSDPKKEIGLVTANHTRLMDLKVFGTGRQNGSNSCSANNTCSHLCLSLPNNSYTCDCPDGLKKSGPATCVCPDGQPVQPNGACKNSHCQGNDTFKCGTSDFCIPREWLCDGDDDCGNGADESSETCSIKCNPSQFQCVQDQKCIPDGWRCDLDNDCQDGSDEKNCDITRQCPAENHFVCSNGRCIMKSWVCDLDDDCFDSPHPGGLSSDEQNCTVHPDCGPQEFKCPGPQGRCIANQYLCDGDFDCSDGADEKNCTNAVCPDWKFHCTTSNECIMTSWRCDGDTDCVDGSDELHCTDIPTTVSPFIIDPFQRGNCSSMKQFFECVQSKKCIPSTWRCDRVNDCGEGDASDEMGCDYGIPTASPGEVTVEPPQEHCPIDHWRCESAGHGDGPSCIVQSSVCDGYPDCVDASDERNCQDKSKGHNGCLSHQILCGQSNVCVNKDKICNGKRDCPNGFDESACVTDHDITAESCNRGQLRCDVDSCVPLYRQCNGHQDCFDNTDEQDCDKHEKVYQVAGISVQTEGLESDEILIEWWVDPLLDPSDVTAASKKNLRFIPSYCEIVSKSCMNASSPISDRHYTFKNLTAYTNYSITVFVQVDDKIYPPAVYTIAQTIEDVPSEPYGLQVSQLNLDKVCVSWKAPHTPNGRILRYNLYFSPPLPPAQTIILEDNICISNKQSKRPFQPNQNYTFWVSAENSLATSNTSLPYSHVFKGEAVKITKVQTKDVTAKSATLAWTTQGDETGGFQYSITCTTGGVGFRLTVDDMKTDKKSSTVTMLASGTQYSCDVTPIHPDGVRGVSSSVTFTTIGAQLPKLEGLRVTQTAGQTNQFQVSWSTPSKVSSTWTYGVFYGKSIEELSGNKPKIATKSPLVLNGLEACESYFIDVAIIEDGGVGPLTENLQTILTGADMSAPPKKLRIDPNHGIHSMNNVRLTWEAPCPVLAENIGYNITFTDLKTHQNFSISNVSYSTNSKLMKDLNIDYGAEYDVTVSTSVVGGRSSAPLRVRGPAIPFPSNIQECNACSSPTMSWIVPDLPKVITSRGPVKYKVWLSSNKDFVHPKTYLTDKTNYTLDSDLEPGIYYVAVSVVDAQGVESPRSSPIIHQHLDAEGENTTVTFDEKSLVGIVITVLIVVAVLVAALGVFVVRHKRLQTSFLNFASSHYSSQSGAATFQQQSLGTLEDPDSEPVIRGFADDEPLIP